jgi:hypothetical protein
MKWSSSSFLMICTFNHYRNHMRELQLHDVLVALIYRGILPTQEVFYCLRYIFFFFLNESLTSEINIFLPFFLSIPIPSDKSILQYSLLQRTLVFSFSSFSSTLRSSSTSSTAFSCSFFLPQQASFFFFFFFFFFF